ncbi:MAG: XTP/dITP diphosphatase [Clostridiales bacterium]|nr:XTP/dITP diphosphatase [Clostridiales bacterium]
METIIAASQNRGKIKEMEAITKEFGMQIISRGEAGVADIDITEDGATFEENSLKKAREIMKLCGKATIADDSGVEVDALGGEPGIFSARYAGAECDDKKNRDKLLKEMEGVPLEKRTARFVSVISMAFPSGSEITARGECEGHIAFEERGAGGFGYDSLFIPIGHGKTFAELKPEEKNAISHRANALKLLRVNLERQNV